MRFYRLSVSVRQLVEFVFLKGNLSMSFSSPNRMQQGTQGHQFIQKNRETDDWQNEVSVKYETSKDNASVLIKGRIDGVFQQDDITIVEEIKTFLGNSEFLSYSLFDLIPPNDSVKDMTFSCKSVLHLTQVLVYSYIFLKNNNLKEITARLKYLKLNDNSSYSFEYKFTQTPDNQESYDIKILELLFDYAFSVWLKHHIIFSEWSYLSKQSLLELEFPFKFRDEQRKMAAAVYKTITNTHNLFVRAPTGTGKTLASIFPALKTMGEEKVEKIFYLTAKTIGRTVAENTIKLLQSKGAKVRYCVITAKEKACLKDFALCEPDYCEYTHDFYDKLKRALEYAINFDVWNAETIHKIAMKFQLCPFELSLTLSQYAEVIICDYNYCFDPIILLKRHFDGLAHQYCFLIDEAHNLTDRAREMYSGQISSDLLIQWLETFPNKKNLIYKQIQLLETNIKNTYPLDKDFFVLPKFPESISKEVISIQQKIERRLESKNKPFVKYMYLKIYFQLLFFMNVLNSMSENHIIYFQRNKDKYLLKIFCVNPRDAFAEYLKNAMSSIFFSATLHPFNYFRDILAAKDSDPSVSLLSPFDKEKFSLYLFTGINTMYQNRDNAYKPLAELIYNATSQKKGNYLIYFPSFAFLQNVYNFLADYRIDNLVCQQRSMNEYEREQFLCQFDNQEKPVTALAVLGGIFAEGIDLIGDKLIGCMIISVGLPMLGGEKTFIKDFYDLKLNRGFEYAYRFPGFNKVMQAAGRVIRTEEDKGWVILVDTRYAKSMYKELYPPEWQHFKIFNNLSIINDIKNFWHNEIK